jgi:hypothetical protein
MERAYLKGNIFILQIHINDCQIKFIELSWMIFQAVLGFIPLRTKSSMKLMILSSSY